MTEAPQTKTVNLHGTTDAKVWADEFCKRWTTALCQVPGREGVETEEDFQGIMLGWFANAIMAGVDSVATDTLAASPSRDEIARALWAVYQDEFTYDDALRLSDPETTDGRNHIAGVAYIHELADAILSLSPASPAPVWRQYGEGPDEGTEMLIKSDALIDEDFNEDGIAVGTVGSWGATCAVWNNYQDCYDTKHLEPGTFLVALRLSQPTEQPPQMQVKRSDVYAALRSYALTNMSFEDEPTNPYPLVDLLSNDGDTIESGEREMELLADHIASSLSDIAREQSPQTTSQKRCKGGDMDAFNGDCLWCGAPMGGVCQDRALAGEEGE